MLGEKIGEFHGKVIGQRILPSDGLPKFETAEAAGTILGITARIMATYWSAMQPDGSLYGETVCRHRRLRRTVRWQLTARWAWAASPGKARP
jgi:hypothetical protein